MGNDPVASLVTMPPLPLGPLFSTVAMSLWRSVAIFPGTELSS